MKVVKCASCGKDITVVEGSSYHGYNPHFYEFSEQVIPQDESFALFLDWIYLCNDCDKRIKPKFRLIQGKEGENLK